MFGDCGFKTGLELSGHRSGRECFGTGNGMQQDIKVRLWISAFSVPFNGPITCTSCRLFKRHVPCWDHNWLLAKRNVSGVQRASSFLNVKEIPKFQNLELYRNHYQLICKLSTLNTHTFKSNISALKHTHIYIQCVLVCVWYHYQLIW